MTDWQKELQLHQLAAELGYPVEGGFSPETLELAAQVHQMHAQMEQQQFNAKVAAIHQAFDEWGIPADEDIRGAIVERAQERPALDGGMPDIIGVLNDAGITEPVSPEWWAQQAEEAEPKDFEAQLDEVHGDDQARQRLMVAELERREAEAAADGALAPDAPQADSTPPDLDDPQQRVAWMSGKLASLEQEAA